MAFQLLSGYLPFDDHRNRDQPALSKIWKAILTEEVSFKGSAWQKVPEEAKDFVKLLLNKCIPYLSSLPNPSPLDRSLSMPPTTAAQDPCADFHHKILGHSRMTRAYSRASLALLCSPS